MRFYLLSERKLNMDLASWFVCLMGMGVVFLGLICLILLCFVIGVLSNIKKKGTEPQKAATALSEAPVAQQVSNGAGVTVTENRAEIVAAVSAALAEELGEDVSSIRILSFKKIGG
jgi:sodium pump decarboxylase gamma subunit